MVAKLPIASQDLEADEGYFPRGQSILRRVHSHRAVGLLYGQRALMVGALHPLAFIGTQRHTRGTEMPFQRLVHTGKTFEQVFFGTREEADKALSFVERMHQRVNGEIEEDAGPYAAGTAYDAFDPELMLWTIACMFDSAEAIYTALVRPLDASEREQLWSEYARFGVLFGMPAEAAPGSYGEFREWFEGFVNGPRAHLTPLGRRVGSHVALRIPGPPQMLAVRPALNFVLIGTLPSKVRELYGIDWSRAQALAHAAACRSARGGRPLVPGRLRRGRCEALFEDVAARERLNRANGGPMLDLSGL